MDPAGQQSSGRVDTGTTDVAACETVGFLAPAHENEQFKNLSASLEDVFDDGPFPIGILARGKSTRARMSAPVALQARLKLTFLPDSRVQREQVQLLAQSRQRAVLDRPQFVVGARGRNLARRSNGKSHLHSRSSLLSPSTPFPLAAYPPFDQ